MQQQRIAETTQLDHGALRSELIDRRQRIQAASTRHVASEVEELLSTVNAAIERLEDGSFGACTRCTGQVEAERLSGDPLIQVCLDCLTESERVALEHDLLLASKIQDNLLPERSFQSTSWESHYAYQPHGTVSGDYCDVVPFGDDVIIFVGDISGKGVAAALLMSHLSAIIHRVIAGCDGLVEMMGCANRLFSAAIPINSFATVVAIRLMPEGTVELSNAGHVPPLLHNGHIHQLPSNGFPLGLFSDASYTSQTFHMDAGQRLVVSTDGLIESTNPDDVEYGLDRLADLVATSPHVSPEELAHSLLDNVASYRSGVPAPDDTTLMVVRRKA